MLWGGGKFGVWVWRGDRPGTQGGRWGEREDPDRPLCQAPWGPSLSVRPECAGGSVASAALSARNLSLAVLPGPGD